VAPNIKILDEKTEDGVVNIHISGVIKLSVTSVEEVMRFAPFPADFSLLQ
jgi:hypothetical protein